MSDAIQVVVAHKGAREHFLAARALHRRGLLAQLVTDWYSPVSPAWAGRMKKLSPGLARAFGAFTKDLPRDRVRALNAFGLRSRWTLGRADRQGRLLEAMGRDDQAFARRLAALPLPPHNVFMVYSYAALEALEAEKARGKLTLVDQIDPGRTEWELLREETERWPDYADLEAEPPAGYYERAQAEWRVAHITIVNSEWTRSALVRQGADPRRIEVIPLAYQPERGPPPEHTAPSGGLNVLWLGSVILRKGIAYLVEAARQLLSEPVRFLVAGPIGIHEAALRKAPPNVVWMGAVPRSEAQRLYRSSDVFVLPTLSDGFAITQVEALAHGLPVVTTPNCGAVVEDGRTGFIVPPRDAGRLAEAIRRFVRDPQLAGRMRSACLEASGRFSLASYGERLAAVMARELAALRAGGAPT
jgi:glycosyltransferase involved in cell wall biosynthesis